MTLSELWAETSLLAMRARSSPGTAIAASTALIATTASNSISVKPELRSDLCRATCAIVRNRAGEVARLVHQNELVADSSQSLGESATSSFCQPGQEAADATAQQAERRRGDQNAHHARNDVH